jgi:hypothetical protein
LTQAPSVETAPRRAATHAQGLTRRGISQKVWAVTSLTPEQRRALLGEAERSDVHGRATALTSINTLRPWGVPVLRVLYLLGPSLPFLLKKLHQLSFIHFARWVIVDSLRGEDFRHTHQFFESNFNGTWSQYIDAFSYVVPRELSAVFGFHYAWPGPVPAAGFKRIIARHEYPASHYYSAYPEATATMVLSALEVRRRLDDLRVRARKMDAAQFDAAWRDFLTTVQRHL